jgi:tRNA pseudouridine38-40 synthase
LNHRYFIELSFKGTAYHGWQVQKNATGVQSVVNDGISTLLKARTGTTGCGRTDTGVHASQFYAHFETMREIHDIEGFVYKLNCILPFDISIQKVFEVGLKDNARFSAISRTYEYLIHHRKDPFLQGFSLYDRFVPDIDYLNSLSLILLDYNDFESFSRAGNDEKHHLCNMSEASWRRAGHQTIFKISANRFLRNMVRALTGTLLESAKSNTKAETLRKIIEQKDRSAAGFSVHAHGLYLRAVKYPFI